MDGSRSLAVILPLEFLPFVGAVAYLRVISCSKCLELPASLVDLPVYFACRVQHLVCAASGYLAASALASHGMQETLHA